MAGPASKGAGTHPAFAGQDQDPIVLGAIALAHQLGLQKHTASLVQRLPALAGGNGAPVRVLDYKELITMLQAGAERRRQLDADYGAGSSPIHLLAAMGTYPLADLYHGQLERNQRAETPLRTTPLSRNTNSSAMPPLSS